MPEYQVLLFYKYIDIRDPAALQREIRTLASGHSLTGRVIVADEGINATLEGTITETESFSERFLKDERFSDVKIKKSPGTGKSFPSLSVRVRKEIVGTGLSVMEADPRLRTAPRISADELRDWFEKKRDFVVIDMRNSYEFASGHFKNSVEPGISASRHLSLVVDKFSPLKEKKVVTVCTGGVRCEKMAAYLMHKGFTDVHQLDGGIHSYMEKFPGKDFLGTLYTFDQRLTMHFGGEREIVGACHLCKKKTEQYADCAEPTCHLHFLACEECREKDGRVFCSVECKKNS